MEKEKPNNYYCEETANEEFESVFCDGLAYEDLANQEFDNDISESLKNEMRVERSYTQGFREGISLSISVIAVLLSLLALLWKLWI